MAIIKIIEKPHISGVLLELRKKYDLGMVRSIDRHAYDKWFVKLEPELLKKVI